MNEYFLPTFYRVLAILSPLLALYILACINNFLLAVIAHHKDNKNKRDIQKILSGRWHFSESIQPPNGSMRTFYIRNIDSYDIIKVSFDKDLLLKEGKAYE